METFAYNKIVKVGIEVENMEESIDFYCNKCGMKILERFPQQDGGECVFLDAVTVILELMTPKTGNGNVHHIALAVDDTDKAVEHFRKAGVPCTMPHKVVEENIHLADVADPDGLRIRLFRREN